MAAAENFKLRTPVGFLGDISQTKKTTGCEILVLEDKLSSHLKFTCVIYTKLQTKCTKSDVNQNWLM